MEPHQLMTRDTCNQMRQFTFIQTLKPHSYCYATYTVCITDTGMERGMDKQMCTSITNIGMEKNRHIQMQTCTSITITTHRQLHLTCVRRLFFTQVMNGAQYQLLEVVCFTGIFLFQNSGGKNNITCNENFVLLKNVKCCNGKTRPDSQKL